MNDLNVEVVVRALCALKKIEKCLKLCTLLLFLVLKQPSLFSTYWESLNKDIVALGFTLILKAPSLFQNCGGAWKKSAFVSNNTPLITFIVIPPKVFFF